MNARIIPFRHPHRPAGDSSASPVPEAVENLDQRAYWRGYYAGLEDQPAVRGGTGDPYVAGFLDAARIIGDGMDLHNRRLRAQAVSDAYRGWAEAVSDAFREGFRHGRDEQRRWDRRVAR